MEFSGVGVMELSGVGVMKLSGVGMMELTQVECATCSTSLVQSHVQRDGVLVHQRGRSEIEFVICSVPDL
jgi:hypothetical protein